MRQWWRHLRARFIVWLASFHFYGDRAYKCRVCGRPLHGAKSRKLGVGPTCAAKESESAKLEKAGQQRLLP